MDTTTVRDYILSRGTPDRPEPEVAQAETGTSWRVTPRIQESAPRTIALTISSRSSDLAGRLEAEGLAEVPVVGSREWQATVLLEDREPKTVEMLPEGDSGTHYRLWLRAQIVRPAERESEQPEPASDAASRREARKTVLKQRLHGLGLAISTYRMAHDGEYPPELELLEEQGYLGADNPLESFSPFGREVQYVIPDSDDPDEALLYHWPPFAGGTWLLYQDHSLDWVEIEDSRLANPRTDELIRGAPKERPEAASFGPVIERVVSDDSEETEMFIDLDGTRLRTPPEGLDPGDSDALMRWIRDSGVDALCETSVSVRGLVCFEMVVHPTSETIWERGSAEHVSSRELLATGTPGSPVFMTAKGDPPATYMFRTREGGMGILQIVGFTEDPEGVRIRYRMVQGREAAAVDQGVQRSSSGFRGAAPGDRGPSEVLRQDTTKGEWVNVELAIKRKDDGREVFFARRHFSLFDGERIGPKRGIVATARVLRRMEPEGDYKVALDLHLRPPLLEYEWASTIELRQQVPKTTAIEPPEDGLPSYELTTNVQVRPEAPWTVAGQGKISGIVRDAAGNPARGALVIACDESTGMPVDRHTGRPLLIPDTMQQMKNSTFMRLAHGATDEAGRFEIDALPDGRYRLIAQRWPGQPWPRMVGMGRAPKQPVDLELLGTKEGVVVEGGQADEVALSPLGRGTLVFDPPPAPSGIVFVSTEPPVADAALGLWSFGWDFRAGVMAWTPWFSRRKFSILNVPEGELHVRAEAGDGAPSFGGTAVELEEGGRAQVRFPLVGYEVALGEGVRPPERLRALVDAALEGRLPYGRMTRTDFDPKTLVGLGDIIRQIGPLTEQMRTEFGVVSQGDLLAAYRYAQLMRMVGSTSEEVDETVERTAEGAGPTFRPVIGLEVPHLGMVDLDLKRVMSPPPELDGAERQALLRWARQTGADIAALGGPRDGWRGLAGYALAAAPIPSVQAWQKTSAAEVVELAADARTDTPVWLPERDAGQPAATGSIYAFRTREGGMGILQIVGFTEDPEGVRIRYKMVHEAEEEYRPLQVAGRFLELLRGGEDDDEELIGLTQPGTIRAPEEETLREMRNRLELSEAHIVESWAAEKDACVVTSLFPLKGQDPNVALGIGLLRDGGRWLVRDVDFLLDEQKGVEWIAAFRDANPDARRILPDADDGVRAVAASMLAAVRDGDFQRALELCDLLGDVPPKEMRKSLEALAEQYEDAPEVPAAVGQILKKDSLALVEVLGPEYTILVLLRASGQWRLVGWEDSPPSTPLREKLEAIASIDMQTWQKRNLAAGRIEAVHWASLALVMYRSDHDDEHPPDLDVLAEEGYLQMDRAPSVKWPEVEWILRDPEGDHPADVVLYHWPPLAGTVVMAFRDGAVFTATADKDEALVNPRTQEVIREAAGPEQAATRFLQALADRDLERAASLYEPPREIPPERLREFLAGIRERYASAPEKLTKIRQLFAAHRFAAVSIAPPEEGDFYSYLVLQRTDGTWKLRLFTTSEQSLSLQKRLDAVVELGFDEAARLDARRSVLQQRLHGLGLAINLYGMDHEGEYPSDLEVLEEQGYLGEDNPLESFSPFGREVQYVIPDSDDPHEALLYHWPPFAGGTWLLYQDLSLDWVEAEGGRLVNPRTGEVVRSAPKQSPANSREQAAAPADGELHEAAAAGDARAIGQLLAEGADVNALNDEGKSPLHVAAEAGQVEVCRALLDAGAELEAREKRQFTPLAVAAFKDQPETVELLLERGADVNAKNVWIWTPLHCAAQIGATEVARTLVEHGADPTVESNRSETPLDLAASRGWTEIVALLASDTPETRAAEEKWGEVGKVLITRGAKRLRPMEVRVLSEKTGEPVPGATVSFRIGGPRGERQTGEQGV
ncbi:MAG: ankyrin repeat domain-containing protein, partial [Candidatus Brocadiaceae bacterium]